MDDKNRKIFQRAAVICGTVISRETLSSAVVEDKTGTLRKYIRSFGLMQCALDIQEAAGGRRRAVVHISSMEDLRNGRQTRNNPYKVTLSPPKLSKNKSVTLDDVLYNYTAADTVISNVHWVPGITDVSYTAATSSSATKKGE